MGRKRKTPESPINGSSGDDPQVGREAETDGVPSGSPVGEPESSQAQPPTPEAEPGPESLPASPKAKRREELYAAPSLSPASVKHEAELRDPDAEAEASKPKLPKKRDLGGRYRCDANVRFKRVIRPPGTVLELTDAEARHYLEFSMISPLD